MKRNPIIAFTAILVILLSSCVKEPAVLDLDISIAETEVNAGEAVVFSFAGNADYITFYPGLEGQSYGEYPYATSLSVSLAGSDNFEYIYNHIHQTVTATFVAASYGNWGEESMMEQFDFDITVSDNRTGILSFTAKSSGLFGQTFDGIINEDNSTISLSVSAGTNLTALTTSLITESILAKVKLNGADYVDKSLVDYSGDNVVFQVVAAGGNTQDWTVLINTN